jgi:hypothetical protein
MVNPVRTPTWADKVDICHKTGSKKNPTIDMEVNKKNLQLYMDHGDYYGNCSEAIRVQSLWDMEPSTYAETRDFHCENIKGGCTPSLVISSDNLSDDIEGPKETELIGNLLKERLPDHTIDKEAWDCIWNKLVNEGEGPKTLAKRDLSEEPNLSQFSECNLLVIGLTFLVQILISIVCFLKVLEEMIYELDRIISKYSLPAWQDNVNAAKIVSLFKGQLPSLKTELDEVLSGMRTLTVRDFLGPSARK